MAQQSITTIIIVGSLTIWILMAVVIYKLFVDRHKELQLIRDIKKELGQIRKDLQENKT